MLFSYRKFCGYATLFDINPEMLSPAEIVAKFRLDAAQNDAEQLVVDRSHLGVSGTHSACCLAFVNADEREIRIGCS